MLMKWVRAALIGGSAVVCDLWGRYRTGTPTATIAGAHAAHPPSFLAFGVERVRCQEVEYRNGVSRRAGER